MNGLEQINKDIIEKIDNLNENENIKKFLKEALIEEYTNRNDPVITSLADKKNPNYKDIIERYCE